MKITILKKGTHNNKGISGRDFSDKITPICGAVTLVKGKHTTIVDTGYKDYSGEIVKALKKQWLKPEDINYIINTHAHLDHCSNNYLFPNAKIITKGLRWSKNTVEKLKDAEIDLGDLKILDTPGHLEEHISVIVKDNGKTYVISGDAVREDKIRNNDLNKQGILSARKIFKIADVIIPGHGDIIEGDKLKELKKILEV